MVARAGGEFEPPLSAHCRLSQTSCHPQTPVATSEAVQTVLVVGQTSATVNSDLLAAETCERTLAPRSRIFGYSHILDFPKGL